MKKASKIFWPILVTPKNAVVKNVEATSRSQRLMTEMGLIKPAHNGTFQIMPLAQRAIDKCVDLVDRQMQSVDGQKITMPILTASSLWKKSGRLNGDISEFFMLHDRHGKEFLLSPTHEEAVTAMLATAAPVSYRQLPLRLYQIGPKFRDELKARFGLMRAKEFLMKDMYTFDRTGTDAEKTYKQLSGAYESFFRQLEVPFAKVEAATGMMGGSESHEYHFIAETGEDHILLCSNCGHASNVEVVGAQRRCTRCESVNVEEVRGIEVGHTFLLGDKYSQPLAATYLNDHGKPESLLMGCYGIGISRIVAAALEVLSSDTELRWPSLLVPYDVCVIGPKQGSKEQTVTEPIENAFLECLGEICKEDILHDDRKYLTIGKRFMDAKKMGYPIIVVVGAKSADEVPKLELHLENKRVELEQNEVLSEIMRYMKRKVELRDQLEQKTSRTSERLLG